MSDYPTPLAEAEKLAEARLAGPRPPGPAIARWKADLALVGNTFIWGATFVLVKEALDDVSTIVFLALRFTLAGLILAVAGRRALRAPGLPMAGLLVGGALFTGYLFQTWGLLYTTPSKSAFITGFSIVLVPVLLGFVYRKFAGWGTMAGVGAATAGLYLLTMPPGSTSVNRGDLLTVVCALAFALHIVLLGHYSGRLPAAGLAAGQVTVAAGLALVAAPWAEPIRLQASLAVFGAVAITGLLATALAFFVQTWAQQYTTPTHTALIFSMEPVFASLTSWVLLDERLGGAAWAGAVLILAGIIAAEVFASRTPEA